MMQILSINIGKEQAIGKAGKGGTTGIYKKPVSEPVQVTPLGLSGDVIVDRKNHGGPDQAIYIYGEADYDWWNCELGEQLTFGTFGENITVSELVSSEFSVGDRLMIGKVTLEVTAPRIPCGTLSARMDDRHFVKRFRAAERPGLYCRVIRLGILTTGDQVVVERYSGNTVGILEMFHNFYLPPNEEYLRRCLAAPIAIRSREEMEATLKTILDRAK